MSIDTVLGVLKIALTEEIDKTYFKYVTKTIDYKIEFLHPVKILFIPEIINVYAITVDKNKVLADLLKSITDIYTPQTLPCIKDDSIGRVNGVDKLKVFSVTAHVSSGSKHIIDINILQTEINFLLGQ